MNIEVRGWHVQKKIMFSPEEMAADQLTLLPTGQFINVSGDSTRLSQIYPIDKFIPLLFTGRRDKNDVKIFEGDLVCYRVNAPYPAEVYFDKRDCGFRLRVIREMQYDKTYPMLFAQKVVGNIYENPELQEVK